MEIIGGQGQSFHPAMETADWSEQQREGEIRKCCQHLQTALSLKGIWIKERAGEGGGEMSEQVVYY